MWCFAPQTLAKVVNKYTDATETNYRLVHDNTVTAMGKIMGLQVRPSQAPLHRCVGCRSLPPSFTATGFLACRR